MHDTNPQLGDYPLRYIERDYTQQQKKEKLFRNVFYHAQADVRGGAYKDLDAFLYDIDRTRIMRREKTALKYLDVFRADMEKECPAVKGIYYTEEEWAWMNCTMNYSYDALERDYSMLNACAVWLLEEIDAAGKFSELSDLVSNVPRVEADSENWTLLGYPAYEDEDIDVLRYVLKHRNDDCKGYRKKLPDKLVERRYERIWNDDLCAKDEAHQDVPSRRLFEAVVSLVPQQRIQAIKDDYRKQWQDLLRRYCACRKVIVDKQKEFQTDDQKFQERLEEGKLLAENQERAMRNGSMAFSNAYANPLTNPEKLRTNQILAELDQLGSKEEYLFDRIDYVRDAFREFPQIPLKEFEAMNGPEFTEIMKDFWVRDPYGTCMAAFLLLDEGDDLMWLYGISSPLVEAAACELPWAGLDLDLDVNEEASTEPEEEWFRCRLYDHRENADMRLVSPAQLIYQKTGVVLPRCLHYYHDLDSWKDYGLDDHQIESLQPLMAVLYLQAVRNLSLSDFHPEEKVYVMAENHEDQQEALTRLKKENESLQKRIQSLSRKARGLQEELDETRSRSEEDRHELTSLREAIFDLQQNHDAEKTEGSVHLPYEVQKKTIVFGGHATFISGMQNLLKGNVRFIDTNKGFDTAIIEDADMIWLQTNSMSHSAYYRIMNVVRGSDVALQYFTLAGTRSCAVQLALLDQKN